MLTSFSAALGITEGQMLLRVSLVQGEAVL